MVIRLDDHNFPFKIVCSHGTLGHNIINSVSTIFSSLIHFAMLPLILWFSSQPFVNISVTSSPSLIFSSSNVNWSHSTRCSFGIGLTCDKVFSNITFFFLNPCIFCKIYFNWLAFDLDKSHTPWTHQQKTTIKGVDAIHRDKHSSGKDLHWGVIVSGRSICFLT